MELGKRIREYRTAAKWNQDEFAEKMFVSRQTISNWGNDKSYPDIQSLLLISNLFDVSLDQLVKGDIETMQNVINEKDVKELNYYARLMIMGMIIIAITVYPVLSSWGLLGLIPLGALYAVSLWAAFKVEAIKKNNDIQSSHIARSLHS